MPAAHKTARIIEPQRSILVFQGGGALGAYQAGVFEAFEANGRQPDWVVGTSIGAINAALIAGNPPKMRLERIRTFWDRMSRPETGLAAGWSLPEAGLMLGESFGSTLRNLHTMAFGLPGFFQPQPMPHSLSGWPPPLPMPASMTFPRCARPCSNWSISTTSPTRRYASRSARSMSRAPESIISIHVSVAWVPSTFSPAERCRRLFRQYGSMVVCIGMAASTRTRPWSGYFMNRVSTRSAFSQRFGSRPIGHRKR